MNDRILDISELLILQKERPLTAAERSIIEQWVLENPENALLVNEIQDGIWVENELTAFAHYDVEKSRKTLISKLDGSNPGSHIHILKTSWFRNPPALKLRWAKYAAAIIIIFGIGSYLYMSNQKEKPSVTQANPVPVQNDVAPGGNRATLTLADGSKINLDSAANGQLAREANARITKTADGKVVYEADVRLGEKIQYNMMATPRGGQYQLTLPDGSQVWLNAESSITYPTAFVGNDRKVVVTGEVYFEVAKDKTKKFIVSVENKQDVEVLGTQFNVNAYKDESTIKTTLIEGLVKITTRQSPLIDVHTSLLLQPGQQGQLDPKTEKLSLAANPDVEQVMAWKKGLFDFNNADLPTVMRQLERWYDIHVKYEGNVPQFEFKGKLPMNLQLSQVLSILRKVEVKYHIEGRTLIVSP